MKEIHFRQDYREVLEILDLQLIKYGREIIRRRTLFVQELNEIIQEIHQKLSGGQEQIVLGYEANVQEDQLEQKLQDHMDRDIHLKTTTAGPHRDDLSFLVNDIDIRKFGSQGQQRTAALSLKLSEIELDERRVHDTPVLLLDDVLSELDSSRQNYLLNQHRNIQTLIHVPDWMNLLIIVFRSIRFIKSAVEM